VDAWILPLISCRWSAAFFCSSARCCSWAVAWFIADAVAAVLVSMLWSTLAWSWPSRIAILPVVDAEGDFGTDQEYNGHFDD
jgi:hypothetical protein